MKPLFRVTTSLLSLLVGSLCAMPGCLAADDPPAAATDRDASEAPLAKWTRLVTQRDALEKEMLTLQAEFPQADLNRRKAIRGRTEEMVQAFQTDLMPEMLRTARIVYEAHPDNRPAAEFVMQEEFHENRYEAAMRIGEGLIKVEHTSPVVLNVTGVAHYANHQFQRATELLETARKNQALDMQLGGKFLEAAASYPAMWEAEQALRAAEAALPEDRKLPQVLLKTSRGDILLELFEDQAPNTVANFIQLVERQHYDGTKFHRVMPNFMAQGGDPNTLDDNPANDGQGGPGYTISCECYRQDARKHFAGSLSMAHAGKDSGGSQFFLTHLPTHWLNPSADAVRPSGHTVFGRVVTGLDIVRALAVGDVIRSATVVRKRDHEYVPKTAAARR